MSLPVLVEYNLLKTDNLQTDLQPNLLKTDNLQTDLQPDLLKNDNLQTDLQPNLLKTDNLQTNLQPEIKNLQLDCKLELKNKIITMEQELKYLKAQFYSLILLNLLNISNEKCISQGISNINIKIDADEWIISYNHLTKEYNENNYINDIDSEVETEIYEKNTNIKFGFKKIKSHDVLRHFITGNPNQKFKVYRNSKKILSIINTQYELELDIDEHISLIEKYSNNLNIPEWLALKTFLFIRSNELSDKDFISYLSI